MVSIKRIRIILILIFILIIASTVLMFLYINNQIINKPNYEEPKVEHYIENSDTYLLAYGSTPTKVIESAKEYITMNDFDGKDIKFFFANSEFTYDSRYPVTNGNFIYYVEQRFKNTIITGYFGINKDGEIVIEHNLLTHDELSFVQTEPDIGFSKALDIARDYLCIGQNTPLLSAEDLLYHDLTQNLLIFVYSIQFKDSQKVVYINGITGDVVYESEQ